MSFGKLPPEWVQDRNLTVYLENMDKKRIDRTIVLHRSPYLSENTQDYGVKIMLPLLCVIVVSVMVQETIRECKEEGDRDNQKDKIN